MAVGDRMNRSNARLSPIIAAGSRKETIPRWLNIVSFVTSQKPSRESAHPHGDDSHDQTRFRTHTSTNFPCHRERELLGPRPLSGAGNNTIHSDWCPL